MPLDLKWTADHVKNLHTVLGLFRLPSGSEGLMKCFEGELKEHSHESVDFWSQDQVSRFCRGVIELYNAGLENKGEAGFESQFQDASWNSQVLWAALYVVQNALLDPNYQAPSAQAHVISPNDILADPAGIAAAFLQSSEELLLKRLVEAARFDATIIDTRWIDFYATPVDGDIRRQTADSEKAAEDLDLYLHLTKTYVKSCIPQEGTTIKELEANFGKEIAYGSMGRDKFMDILNDNARISQPSSRTASRSRKGTGPAAKTGKQG